MHIPPPKIRRRQKLKNLSQKAMKHQGILFLFSGGTSTAVSISIYWLMLNIVLNTTKHAELWFIKIRWTGTALANWVLMPTIICLFSIKKR